MQREMPFLESLPKAAWVPSAVVTGWATYRDAVLWCWLNRARNSRSEIGGLNPFSFRACSGLVPSFEAFTGWRGVTQYMAGIGNTTVMEQVIAQRAAA